MLGDPQTGRRLLLLEAIGLGGVISGIGLLGAVGGSDKLAPVYVPVSVYGASLFALSFLADVVGSARGSEPWALPADLGPGARARIGWGALWAAPYGFAHTVDARLALTGPRSRLRLFGSVAPSGGYGGGGLEAGWLLAQREADPLTSLQLFGSVRHHAFSADGFRITVAEAWLEGRWNLRDLAPTLANTWLISRLGAGIDLFGYSARRTWADDALPLLVVDAGFGLQAHHRVGFELVYRHRKDELPGGLVGSGLTGFLGFLEFNSRVELPAELALVPSLRWGRGVLTCLALESRF